MESNKRSRIKYELQVWNKIHKKYITTWIGHNFVRAQIMAAKPYNNHVWMGKKRIISIRIQIELIIPHVRGMESH